MNTIIVFIFLIIGFLAFTFTMLSTLICLFFGIPVTNKLNKAGFLVKNNPIIRRYWGSISLLTATFLLISGLSYVFGPRGALTAYVIGAIFSFIISVGKMGGNSNNMQDYIDTQSMYFSKSIEETIYFLAIGKIKHSIDK
jgi:hypothetical protein